MEAKGIVLASTIASRPNLDGPSWPDLDRLLRLYLRRRLL